jgi:hypothetical protein
MTTTHATPVADPSRPNPLKHPLLALKYVLFGYLPLGGPAWLSVPLDFVPLAHLVRYANYFVQEGYVSTLMCFLIPMFLLMIDRQLARKKRAYGGKLFANYFTVADLKQEPANREALRLQGSDALFHLLKEELRLLFRLLRAAQVAYRLGITTEVGWQPIHRAAMIVLLRIAQISAALRRKASTSVLPEECVRYQARLVWNEFFGGASAPEGEREWLEPLEIKPHEQRRIAYHLRHEQVAGRPIPAPFVGRFELWAAELSA